MVNFIMGFLLASVIFGLIIFNHFAGQKKLEYQLDLIINEKSTSLLKVGSSLFSKGLLNNINMIIEILLKEKKEYEISKQNFKDITTAISHDFRTPLTSISGYVQMLKENKDLQENDRKKYLEIIENRATSLSDLIEDFYTSSSIDSYDYQKELQNVSLSNILRAVVANYYPELEKSYKDIKIDIGEKNYVILSDKISLERIFSNLIKNSFVYGTNKFEIKLEEQNNSYLVRLSNEKPVEFTHENLKKLFNRNYSVNWRTGHKSTGLGLSIAKRLVEQSNGNIKTDIEGEMLIFEISFPKV